MSYKSREICHKLSVILLKASGSPVFQYPFLSTALRSRGEIDENTRSEDIIPSTIGDFEIEFGAYQHLRYYHGTHWLVFSHVCMLVGKRYYEFRAGIISMVFWDSLVNWWMNMLLRLAKSRKPFTETETTSTSLGSQSKSDLDERRPELCLKLLAQWYTFQL